jgi:hypothetical protein
MTSRFDGRTARPEDQDRLGSLLERIRELMSDEQWRTHAQIVEALRLRPASSVRERLRDLRKPRFGGYHVDAEHVAGGLWRYRVRAPAPPPTAEQTEMEW